MKIKIYSDAADTWSFGEEKVLRAVDYIYNGQVEFYNVMGGLFSDYRDLLPMNMKDKDSTEMANNILFEMWKTGANFHKMPMMKSAPNLLSREKSSIYPIDIAFTAARLADKPKANIYLRALREATILYGRNTMDKNVQIEIAEEIGINKEDYIYFLENEAEMEFLQDRMDSFDHRFTIFPNFIYKNSEGKEIILKGYKNLKDLMEFIDENENLDKREIKTNRVSILEFISRYNKVFEVELFEIFNRNETEKILSDLRDEKIITISEAGTGFEIEII